MQTFLPYHEFDRSLACLDQDRLNKQITEANQILSMVGYQERSRWENHPAVKMWVGFPGLLASYIRVACLEWWDRGFITHKRSYELADVKFVDDETNGKMPYWWNDNLFHASHRSNLLFKQYNYYKRWEWKEADEPYIPYVWPTFYSAWHEKIFSDTGIKSLIKGIKRRGLWKENTFQWPGSYPEWEIYLGSTKLGSSPFS